jgi:NADH:ubiquinone reductase (H+-translocating)
MKQILILGGGYAGMMAALRLSHTTKRMKDVQVTLVSGASQFVERIRLHEVAANRPPKAETFENLLKGTGLRFLQGWISDIQPNSKLVTVKTENETLTLHYDKLVYALGSRVNKEGIAGINEHAYTLDPDSAAKMQARLKTLPNAGRVIVIGGGLTGIEGATEIAESYPKLKVSLITNEKLGQNLSNVGQNYLYQAFNELGIEVLEQTAVKAIEAQQVVLTNGKTFPADLVLWAAGFVVPGLAKEAGLAVNKQGRILVDPYLRSRSHPDIYAAGDVMDFSETAPLSIRMSCQAAMPLGAHVGDNLAAWLKGKELASLEFGYSAQCISLGQKRGLLQFINPDDSMVEKAFTGWQASIVKKLILLFTFGIIKLERILPYVYQWPHNIKQTEQAQERILQG